MSSSLFARSILEERPVVTQGAFLSSSDGFGGQAQSFSACRAGLSALERDELKIILITAPNFLPVFSSAY